MGAWDYSDLIKKGFVKNDKGEWAKGEATQTGVALPKPKRPVQQVYVASPDALSIIIRQYVPGLNGSEGLIRENRFKRKERKSKILKEISEQPLEKFMGTVRVVFEFRAIKLRDWDNMAATFKLIGDCLVDLGVIRDDSPDIIVDFIPRQVKVGHRIDEIIMVYIEPV